MDVGAELLEHLDRGSGSSAGSGRSAESSNASGRIPSTTCSPDPGGRSPVGERDVELPEPNTALVDRGVDEIHRRRADESSDEQVGRPLVELLRRVDLEEAPVAHHGDALPEGHRLGLVVRHVDGRHTEALVQLRERRAHADSQLRVEVRKGLVEQERLRLAHDRAAHRDALALAA